ncbi:hypothetical protein [Paenibacillus sp. FSL E2-0190]|uniref:hypothetical protein n=1 Tax=Paenibacillus sp. FSL E2-0190 TaxID=2954504 RepID=UPI0030EDB1E0
MTPVRIEENKLKKGDRVVMHTCIESEEEPGKIWTCKTDQFTRGNGVFAQDSVFLEGYSGSFAPEFLQKVVLPSEDERVLAALEESQQRIGKLELYVKSLEFNREDTQKRANEKLRERDTELVEAQQIIVRQRKALEFYANQEHWSLPSFGRGQSKVTSDRGSKARELLKEGTTMPVTPNCPTCGNQHLIDHPSRPGIYLCVVYRVTTYVRKGATRHEIDDRTKRSIVSKETDREAEFC